MTCDYYIDKDMDVAATILFFKCIYFDKTSNTLFFTFFFWCSQ